MHFSAVHCFALHCTALHCIALYCIALHCIALHCIALHCIKLHCFGLHCIALIALQYIALHCIALHCIAMYSDNICVSWQRWWKETLSYNFVRTDFSSSLTQANRPLFHSGGHSSLCQGQWKISSYLIQGVSCLCTCMQINLPFISRSRKVEPTHSLCTKNISFTQEYVLNKLLNFDFQIQALTCLKMVITIPGD